MQERLSLGDLTDRQERLLQLMQKIPDYPFDNNKDLQLIQLLEDEFPNVDLVECVNKFRAWSIDHKTKNWRLRIRNFVKVAAKDQPRYRNAMDFTKYKRSGRVKWS